MGLENVKERLNMMCGGTLELSPSGSGTLAAVYIPIGFRDDKLISIK